MDKITRWPAKVVAAGECMLELSGGPEQWRLGAAGDSFNTALYLRRAGAQVRYLTALGTDPFSEEMLQSWGAEGIDCSLVLRDPARLPGLYAIRTDGQGERSFHYWRGQSAARELLRLPEAGAALAAAAQCDLLYLTGITLSLFDAAGQERLLELARAVRAGGGRVAFDPNYRPRGWVTAAAAGEILLRLAPCIDLLLTTDADEHALWGFDDPAQSFAHWGQSGIGEIVVKQGGAGATLRRGAQQWQVPVPSPVTVVDTTGAGDAFNAAYIAARLRGEAPPAAALAGHRLAGQVIQIRGAILPREHCSPVR